MAERIEMATISSRGQVCIPTGMREEMGLKEGSRVLFILTDSSLILKKVNMNTFRQITAPLKAAARRLGLKETNVADIVHRARKK